MIRPKRTSETRSLGSQPALGGPFEGAFRHGALKVEALTSVFSFETVAKQPADNNEKDAGRGTESRQRHQ